MTEEQKKPAWGAHWLLPDNWTAAWGARAIADEEFRARSEQYKPAMHIANVLPDRQAGAGKNEDLLLLRKWINKKLLPIKMLYDGRSEEITILDDGEFHARWTPNKSYGYIYIVAWMD